MVEEMSTYGQKVRPGVSYTLASTSTSIAPPEVDTKLDLRTTNMKAFSLTVSC